MKEHAQILRQQIPATPALYRKVYRYTFPVSREPPARTLPIEIAVEHWQLLFSSAKGGVEMNTPTTPWRDWWLEFYTEKISRPVNKDLWEQVEVFLEKAKEDESLGWHSEDGAWPGALDEFAVFVKAKRGALP
ncbi:Scaffold-type E3 ligase [Ascosphaera atra]|nr:Scaffold-type E3 ligase [Ascosphaera atra]